MNKSKGLTKPSCVAMLFYPKDSSDASCDIVKATIHTVLSSNGLAGFLSPLHKPEDDELKYHYHLMIVRPNRCGFTMSTWREIADLLGAANNYVLPLDMPHKHSRYIIHEGYPDKIQYSANDVITYGDLDYLAYKSLHDADESIKADKNIVLIDIINYVCRNQVILFAELVDYAIVTKPEWLPVIKSSTSFITSYMRSMEYRAR